MPRINLSVSQELYDRLKQEADSRYLSVNSLVVSELEKTFMTEHSFDYSIAMESLKNESEQMDVEFTLSDLPTFKNVDKIIIEKNIKESPASIRARLGKIYNEAVRNGQIAGVDRAIIEKNGSKEYKFISRAAVYVNKLSKHKGGLK